MTCMFFSLLMLNGGIGVAVWIAGRRIIAHLRANPQAARLVSEHVITPLLTGGEESPDKPEEIPDKPNLEPKRTKGTLV